MQQAVTMPALPLPFLIPLLLGVLLIRIVRQKRPRNKPVILFISLCIASSTVVALRWSFGLEIAKLCQPVMAALVPPAAWLCFAQLKDPGSKAWPYLLATGALLSLSAVWFPWNWIDLFIVTLYLGTGAALIGRALGGWNRLGAVRLTDAARVHASLYLSGGVLIGAGICDSIVAADFDLYGGVHAAKIVAVCELIILPLLAYAVASVGSGVAPEIVEEAAPVLESSGVEEPGAPAPDDQRIFAIFDALMREKALFTDPDLTLNRLARRAGVPSRKLSIAINRAVGRNISQVVNEYRISEAQRLLLETNLPVTTVMERVGFRTKSNFNREFLRVTGHNPSAFRQSSRTNPHQSETVSAT